MPIYQHSPRSRALFGALTIALLAAVSAQAEPVIRSLSGRSFVNKGLVGVGRIPANTKDKFGETLGSFSAMAMQPGSWVRNADGSYSGTLLMQPDRGYNVSNTTNYTPRFNKLALVFTPASSSALQNQVRITISDTVKYTEASGTPMTSLDPTVTGSAARAGFPALPQAYNGRLSLDAEGIVVARDGSLYVSDEYGPYIFHFSPEGVLLSAIRPPEALIPVRSGTDSFSSNTVGVGQPVPSPADPVTGRQNNQGLEGLSLSPDGSTLYALLQSATRQDGGTGGSSTTRFNTRLLAYDLTGTQPVLKAEYVLQLPSYLQSGKIRIAAQSDMIGLSNTQFMVLARDGNGHGTATPSSLYRKVLVYDINGATNIAGTKYDRADTPVAPGGVLTKDVTPAQSVEFVDLNDGAELAKFGLHNGPVDDMNNLSEKWEGMTLVSAMDPAAPDDYFLFIGNDNDFMTASGYQDGAAYNAGLENDSLILVYRLTLGGRFTNLSSRALTGSGEGAHVAGFVIDGTKGKTLLIRGVGPSLSSYGISNVVADPVLKVYDADGRELASNDDWGTSSNPAEIRSAFQTVGAFSLAEGSKDAALLINLSPGHYTAHLSSQSTGVSLLEVYELP